MDGFFGIGILELFLIAVLALIVLGPERLPGVMRDGAKYIRMLRKMTNEFTSQFSDELQALDELNPRKIFNEMTDPNKPEPGEKPKTPPAKPPPAKPPTPSTPSTAQTKPKTTPATAKKPAEKATPTAITANGHENTHDAGEAASPNSELAQEDNQTILPPALQVATAHPTNSAPDDAPQPASVVEAVAVGEPKEGQP